MKAKDPYYIAKNIPGDHRKIHLDLGGWDLMQEELMGVNMEYMEQTNRVQLESIFHKDV